MVNGFDNSSGLRVRVEDFTMDALNLGTNVLEDFVGVSEGNIQHMRDEVAENQYKKDLIKEDLIMSRRGVKATLTEMAGNHLWDPFFLAIVPLIVTSFIVFYKHAPTLGSNVIIIEFVSRIFQIGFGAILIWCFVSLIEQKVKTTKEQREALGKRLSYLNEVIEGLSRTRYYDGTVEDFISESEPYCLFGTSGLVELERFIRIVHVVNLLFTLSMLVLSVFEFIE